MQEVAAKSDSNAGDGTTTSTLMTQAIVNHGMKVLAAGANPVSLRSGISLAAEALARKVKELAIPVKSNLDVQNIATISSNSPKMGKILGKIFEKIGNSGSTVIEESRTLNDDVEFAEGLTINRGYVSPYFIQDAERQVSELVSPRVLVTDKKLSSIQDLLPLLEQLAKTKSPLLIIADDISGEALSTLVVNKLRGILDVVAIRAPGFGDRKNAYLRDISIATGANLISEDLGNSVQATTLKDLGFAEKAVVGKGSTTLVTSKDCISDIESRIHGILKEADRSTNQYDKEQLLERAASLGGGIAKLKVGAATETELKDKKLRYEDALNSVRSALESGVVPGGGSTMLFLSNDQQLKNNILGQCLNEDEKLGVEIMFKALSGLAFLAYFF